MTNWSGGKEAEARVDVGLGDKGQPGADALRLEKDIAGEGSAEREGAERERGSAERSTTIWICETDPFLLPLVVGPAARKAGVKLVYYLQDIYPDVAVALGVTRNNFLIRQLRKRLKREYERADAIIVLDDDMRDRLILWGLEPSKLQIVPNWMDCDAVYPIKTNNPFRGQHGLEDSFVVMHSGNMGMTQRLDVLVDAMSNPAIPSNCKLLLVGNGAKRKELEKQVESEGGYEAHSPPRPLADPPSGRVVGYPPGGRVDRSEGRGLDESGRVQILDYQPKERLSESLSAADLHVISMDQAITGCLAPSKLYGILASGTPVLAIVPKGNAVWKLVQEHQLGWTVEPGDTLSIAKAIETAQGLPKAELLLMGQRGRSLAERLFDREICCKQFEDLLTSIQKNSRK